MDLFLLNYGLYFHMRDNSAVRRSIFPGESFRTLSLPCMHMLVSWTYDLNDHEPFLSLIVTVLISVYRLMGLLQSINQFYRADGLYFLINRPPSAARTFCYIWLMIHERANQLNLITCFSYYLLLILLLLWHPCLICFWKSLHVQ